MTDDVLPAYRRVKEMLVDQIGQLTIVAIREKAKARQGSKFSIKAFHNAVLSGGGVPLSVLETEVARMWP